LHHAEQMLAFAQRAQASLATLADAQNDVVRRDQLGLLDVIPHEVENHVRRGRWATHGPNVVILHNGPLTDVQRRWAALLNAGLDAALCARTALEVDGLRGWEDSAVHVLVAKGARPPTLAGIVLHESRRYEPDRDRHPVALPWRTRIERSAIDAAAWSRSPRTACGLLAAVVQQRLTQSDRLLAELQVVGHVRHRRLLAAALADIRGGAGALSEIDFGKLCRQYGLPEPIRQQIRRDRDGRRRYLDAEFRARDGSTVVVEVDGAVHLLVRTYWDDMDRQNAFTLQGDRVLRYPTVAFYLQPARVAHEIGAALGLPSQLVRTTLS
jgi:hypothetical protein